MMIRMVITIIFLSCGFLFMAISTAGVLRLPDFFTRLHSSSIGETLGIILIGIALVIYEGFTFTSAKIIIIVIAMFLANPVGTHLIGNAAVSSGYGRDSYEEKIDEKEREDANTTA